MDFIKRYKNKKLYIEHFNGCPAFTEMTAAGFTSKLFASEFLVYSMCLAFYQRAIGDWYTLPADHLKIGSTIVSNYLKNRSAMKELYGNWHQKYLAMMKNFDQLFNDDLKPLSDDELLVWANKVYDFYRRRISMPGFIDGYMFYADKRFDLILRQFGEKNGIKDYQRIYSVLSAPVQPSFILQEQKELMTITRQSKDKRKFEAKLAAHLNKYGWIKSSYAGYIPYRRKEALTEISQIKKEGKPALDFRKVRVEKNRLIKKYKFTPEIIAITELTELLVKWQDQRKEYTLTFVSLQNKILMEVQRRTGIDFDLLLYSQTHELPPILAGKFSKNKLKLRRSGSLFVYSKGKTDMIHTGKAVIDFVKRVNRIDVGKVKEVGGFVANVGRATGLIRIVKRPADNNKVKPGDILLAAMTRPEHLPAMKKAAAIVTDDGGITCHAAIVARELNKPCIIGTKIATRVFKDGDKVEVDANKGIIRKI